MEAANELIRAAGSCSRWGVFEVEISGPKEGNPFTEGRRIPRSLYADV